MSNADVPIVAVRRQIIEAIDVVVQVQRIAGKRLVTEIAEVSKEPTSSGPYPMLPVFHRASANGDLRRA
jgi:Flp pilus assembly CpaF family ATPase